MSLDFASAEKQRLGGLIPNNTICPVHMTIRPGGAGPDNWFKRNKDGNCLMLDCEFTVISGEYARRKFWSLMTVEGETDGQRKGADITRSRLRAILEAVKGILPSDESAEAIAARRANSYQDFDGLRFQVLVGLEPGKDGYKDKNIFNGVITPDRRDYVRQEQVQKSHGSLSSATMASTAAAPKANGGRPSWAAA